MAAEESSLESTLREALSTSYIDHPAGSGAGTERFELLRELGRGAFGVVYEAVDRRLLGSPSVALKLLRRPHADRLYSFKREFRSLAEVRHRNLVQLYELVASGSDVFFTMELVQGQSPLQYLRARPNGTRDLLRQLAEGLGALHRAGKLHRDVKPSNLLVEDDGRVVLLDFGLAIDLAVGDSHDRAGTPLYMSPEQCAEKPLEEASDWYAVGALLFEALTGRAPFEGTVDEVLRAKQSRDAPRPSAFAPVAEDLDDLCAALLARDPAARPNGDDVRRRLNDSVCELSLDSAPPEAPTRRELFVGRAHGKAELTRLFDQSTRGKPTVVLARGPSGIGKSALLRWFLDDLRGRHPEAMILSGRCFEFESVPFKALDAIVDELARRLRRLPTVEAAALLPRDAHALTMLFPVLRQVPAFARMEAPRHADSGELRGRGLAALRELFARLGDRQPIVVCIDDLQWGDVDSAALLVELLRGPDPPAVFWLIAFRDEDTSPLLARLAQLRETTLADVRTHDLKLAGLELDEAEELAASLLADRGDKHRARAIAVESRGHPFFVCELARAGEGDHALADLVRTRVSHLRGAARRLLEVVAVAAQPLELDVVAAAADVKGELRDALATLRAERLVRAREGRSERLIECYHDRIRDEVVRDLSANARAGAHLGLAQALEAAGGDNAAQIGRHLAEGGQPVRAQGYLVRAAERAAAAMAFEDSAYLYRCALEMAPLPPERKDTIELAYADALSSAGHGPEAARLWLSLVDRVDGPRRIDLRRRATEELLLCGQIEEGYASMNALLAELDLAVPRSKAGAMAHIAVSRATRALQGLRLRHRDAPASERELQRVDTLGSLAWAVVQLDPLTGYALQTQHLQLALRSGDPQRAAVALWLEAPVGALKGARVSARTRRILNAAREMGADLDETQIPRTVTCTVEGIVALFEGRWLDGLKHMDAAESSPNATIIGHGSMRGSIYVMRTMNLYWMGRSGDVLQSLPARIRDMEAHHHLYGWLWLALLESWALGCSGRLDAARSASEEVRARLPDGLFQLHRSYMEFGLVKFFLLEGKAEAAWQQLQEAMRRTRFAMLGQVQRVAALWVRAAVALARAAETPALRGEMLAEARRIARRMEAERVPWVDAICTTVRASIAQTAGDGEEALRLLGQAEPLLEAHQFESVLAVTRLRRGRLLGGEAGRASIDLAETWMGQQRVAPSVSRVLLPGPWEN